MIERKNNAPAPAMQRELTLTRIYDAPRELVWKLWTESKHLAQWWGPDGFTNPVCEIEAKIGGYMKITMRGPDGTDYPMVCVFKEVIKLERLVFTNSPVDKNGKPLMEGLTTVTFADAGGKTKLTVQTKMVGLAPIAAQMLEGMEAGWTQSLERLGVFATPTGEREITAIRFYPAPRELVWKMWTEAEHIKNWWGPKGFTNTIHKMEVRTGGVWSFIMHGPDGRDYDNKIVYTDIVKNERICYDHESNPKFHVTVNFEELYGGTKLTMRMLFATAKIREGVAKEYGAVEGLSQTLGRLGERLANMPAATEDKQTFVISRVFDAPRELVWKAWTDGEHLNQWFGPKGAKIVASKLELKPGGFFHYGMEMPDGKVMWGKWTFREIEPPKRLVLISTFSDEAGGITVHPFAPTWPKQTLSTTTFEEVGGKTRLTIQWSPYNATEIEQKTFAEAHSSMNMGWSGTFEQLATYLAMVHKGKKS